MVLTGPFCPCFSDPCHPCPTTAALRILCASVVGFAFPIPAISAILRYPSVTGDAELGFLTALTMLGGQIPWDKLLAPAPGPRRTGPSY